MRLPFTKKMLMDWAGPRVYHEGKALFESGRVLTAEYEHPFVRGELARGDRCVNSQFELLGDGTADNQCPCRDSTERGIICSHVIALALELIRRRNDPERDRKAAEEMRHAARMAEYDDSAYIQRVSRDMPGAIPARLHLTLARDWIEESGQGRFPLFCAVEYEERIEPINLVPTDLPLTFDPSDEALLFVLEDISRGPAVNVLDVPPLDMINLLNIHAGKPLYEEGSDEPIVVNAAKMSSVLRMDLDRKTGDLILMIHTELPFMDADQLPLYLIAGRSGWVYDARNFWPLGNLLPEPVRGIYEKPVYVERASVPRFVQTELPLLEEHMAVHTDITLDLFSIEPAEPRFRLVVKGSPASLAATLMADYGVVELVAGKPDPAGHFSIPDPDDILRYLVRNPEREAEAVAFLAEVGFSGQDGGDLSPIVGCREVLNFLGSGIPRLHRIGWKVDLEGRVEPFMESLEFATPVVHVDGDTAEGSWFEVGFSYEDPTGQSLSENEIQRALLKGESYIEYGSRTILLDANAIQSAKDIFSDCASGEGRHAGTFRMNSIYSAYVDASLRSLDGIDVEAAPTWLKTAEKQNRKLTSEPITLPDSLESTLRSYQKEGVRWLRFLEDNGFCGILADEMGLGKTLQTLTWLQMDRQHTHATGKPALIVCPTSLVENWADEADRFVPDLRVMTMSGADRHSRWSSVEDVDMVVTSYALMRRDIEKYVEYEFSAIVLDEAQHIKNKSTQNALSAKRLKGIHRLVLTGTPIENSVMDIWSIMDFLMPRYLGAHDIFKQQYESAISQGGQEGLAAQKKLRRKLNPFLLRRLKKDVAKDLPPKIERIASCPHTRDQHLFYKKLVERSRHKLSNLVMSQGFNRSRMEILRTLLRLRQVCCHLDLLKLDDLNSEYPSGKMDLFFELLDEALDGGHRVLVFSQFTSMLAILRRELESRDLSYCYLDGMTKNRLAVVREFNTNRSIPVFLMSLKAGGTGLNLTGADMVIHFDPWWNPAVEDQATDRAHRIGQSRTVYSVKLITKGTVEEKVLALQKRKKAVIDATIVADEDVMQKLTWDDVEDLLSI